MSQITKAPLVIMWWEDHNIWSTVECHDLGPISSYRADVIAMRRHLDGCNFSFVDGHVKWIKLPGDLLDTNPSIAPGGISLNYL